MICSTSRDAQFRMWNIRDNSLVFDSSVPSFVKTYKLGDALSTVHNIIGADYVSNHKGYIVTWQFTPEITIWNPQYSVQNPYIGKYTGHLSPIMNCRLLKTSTFCVSVDKRMMMRVWDVRTLTTSQVLSLDTSFDVRPYLHVLADDNLLLVGRNPKKLANQNVALRKAYSVCAVGVAFNEYHKKLIVATPIDVRLYDCETGRLQDIFVDLVEAGRYIKCFEQGARHRMFYLGDSTGDVTMFNTKNGQKLKMVTDSERDNEIVERFSKIMGMKVNTPQFTTQDKDICCMVYLTDEKLLAVGTANSIIKIYTEVDSEESELNRVFVGGHMESEISCLAFNRETAQFASGSENGIVTIWNMSTGKVDNTFYDLPSKVVGLSFCQCWGCLLVAQELGVLTAWGLKQSGADHSGKSIFKLFHLNSEEGTSLHSIKSMQTVYASEMLFTKNFLPDEEIYRKEKYNIDKMANIFKDYRKDVECVKVINDFSLADLEKDAGALFLNYPSSFMRQNSRELQPIDEHFYVLVGDEKGNLIKLDIIPCLKHAKFPSQSRKSDPSSQPPGIAVVTEDSAKKISAMNRTESIMALSQTTLYLNMVPTRVVMRNVFPLVNPAVVCIQECMIDASLTACGFMADRKTVIAGSLESPNTFVWRDKHCVGAINLRGQKHQSPRWAYKYDWKGEAYARVLEIIKIEAELNQQTLPESYELQRVIADRVKLMFLEKRPDSQPHPPQVVDKLRIQKEHQIGSLQISRTSPTSFKKYSLREFDDTTNKKVAKSASRQSHLKHHSPNRATKILLNTTIDVKEELQDLDMTVFKFPTDQQSKLKMSHRGKEKTTGNISPIKQRTIPSMQGLNNMRLTDKSGLNNLSFRMYQKNDKSELRNHQEFDSPVLKGLRMMKTQEVLPNSDLARILQQKFQNEERSMKETQQENQTKLDSSDTQTPHAVNSTVTGLSRLTNAGQFRLTTQKKLVTKNHGSDVSMSGGRAQSPGEYGIPGSTNRKVKLSVSPAKLSLSKSAARIPSSFQELMSNVKQSYARLKEIGESSERNKRTTSGKLKVLMTISRGAGIHGSKEPEGDEITELSSKKEAPSSKSLDKNKPVKIGLGRLSNKGISPFGGNCSSMRMFKAASLFDSQLVAAPVQDRSVLQQKIQLGLAVTSPTHEIGIRRAFTHK